MASESLITELNLPALGYENGAHDEKSNHVKEAAQCLQCLSFTGFAISFVHGADILADRSHRNNSGCEAEILVHLKMSNCYLAGAGGVLRSNRSASQCSFQASLSALPENMSRSRPRSPAVKIRLYHGCSLGKQVLIFNMNLRSEESL